MIWRDYAEPIQLTYAPSRLCLRATSDDMQRKDNVRRMKSHAAL